MPERLKNEIDAAFTEVTGLPAMLVDPQKPHPEHHMGGSLRDLENTCAHLVSKVLRQLKNRPGPLLGEDLVHMAEIGYGARVRNAIRDSVELEGYEGRIIDPFGSGIQDVLKLMWALIDSHHHQYGEWPTAEIISSWTGTIKALCVLMARYPLDSMNTAATFNKKFPEKPRSSEFQHMTRDAHPFRFEEAGTPALEDETREKIVEAFKQIVDIVFLQRNGSSLGFTLPSVQRRRMKRDLLNHICPAHKLIPAFVEMIMAILTKEYRHALANAGEGELDFLIDHFEKNTRRNKPRYEDLDVVLMTDEERAAQQKKNTDLVNAYIRNHQRACPFAAAKKWLPSPKEILEIFKFALKEIKRNL